MTDLVPANPFFVISGPSGVGKNSVLEGVLEAMPELQKATTYTSRAPRPGELEAKIKYFVSREEFERKIRDEELFEHAEFAGNYYGTPKKELLALLEKGPAITDIEIIGFRQLRETFPSETFRTIFLRPTTVEELTERIRERAPISEEELKGRVDRINEEMAEAEHYDHVIVNETDKLEQTVKVVSDVIREELAV